MRCYSPQVTVLPPPLLGAKLVTGKAEKTRHDALYLLERNAPWFWRAQYSGDQGRST